jgi:hypothetical protein
MLAMRSYGSADSISGLPKMMQTAVNYVYSLPPLQTSLAGLGLGAIAMAGIKLPGPLSKIQQFVTKHAPGLFFSCISDKPTGHTTGITSGDILEKCKDVKHCLFLHLSEKSMTEAMAKVRNAEDGSPRAYVMIGKNGMPHLVAHRPGVDVELAQIIAESGEQITLIAPPAEEMVGPRQFPGVDHIRCKSEAAPDMIHITAKNDMMAVWFRDGKPSHLVCYGTDGILKYRRDYRAYRDHLGQNQEIDETARVRRSASRGEVIRMFSSRVKAAAPKTDQKDVEAAAPTVSADSPLVGKTAEDENVQTFDLNSAVVSLSQWRNKQRDPSEAQIKSSTFSP